MLTVAEPALVVRVQAMWAAGTAVVFQTEAKPSSSGSDGGPGGRNQCHRSRPTR